MNKQAKEFLMKKWQILVLAVQSMVVVLSLSAADMDNGIGGDLAKESVLLHIIAGGPSSWIDEGDEKCDGAAGHNVSLPQFASPSRNLDETDDKGNTRLHIAACRGDANLVAQLVQSGVEINQRNDYRLTALECAAYSLYPGDLSLPQKYTEDEEDDYDPMRRTVINDPRVLIGEEERDLFDDTGYREEMKAVLQARAQGFIFINHMPRRLELCDGKIIPKKCKIVLAPQEGNWE